MSTFLPARFLPIPAVIPHFQPRLGGLGIKMSFPNREILYLFFRNCPC